MTVCTLSYQLIQPLCESPHWDSCSQMFNDCIAGKSRESYCILLYSRVQMTQTICTLPQPSLENSKGCDDGSQSQDRSCMNNDFFPQTCRLINQRLHVFCSRRQRRSGSQPTKYPPRRLACTNSLFIFANGSGLLRVGTWDLGTSWDWEREL